MTLLNTTTMSRITRQSTRKLVSPSPTTATATTNVSPVFSTRTSTVESETPNTSEIDEDLKLQTAKSRASSKLKRAAKNDVDKLDSEESEPVAQPAAKRRTIAKRMYVEIPIRTVSRAKGKARASLYCSFQPASGL